MLLSRFLPMFTRQLRWLRAAIDDFSRRQMPAHLEKVGLRDPVHDNLHEQFAIHTIEWVVVAAFVYRIVATPFVLVGGLSVIGPAVHRYIPVIGGLMVWNALLAVSVTRPGPRVILGSGIFTVVDLALACLVNLWGAAVLAKGTLLNPYEDVFWIYAMGTVAVWTALRGARFGFMLVAGGGLVLLGMAGINQASLAGPGLANLLARFGWLLSAVPLPLIILRLGRQGAGLGNYEGRRAGRALERIRALRLLHDTVLQTLAQIAQRAVAADLPITDRARQIHQLAAEQIASLDSAIKEDDRGRGGLVDGLQDLVRQLGRPALRIELLTADLAADPPRAVTDSLLAATREALTNVHKHAEANHVIVRAATTGRGYTVVVRDQGRGFDTSVRGSGVGIPESIHRRMAEIGGSALVWSQLGLGTRVTLAVDFDAARKMRIGVAPQAAIALSPHSSTSVDALTNQALAWFVVAALVYRVTLSPLQVGSLFANVAGRQVWLFLLVVAGVFTFDVLLLIALLLGRFGRLFRSRTLLVLDLSLTAGLNLWSAHLLPAGTVLLPGHEVLWAYTMGATSFWTGIRGARTGLAVVAGGCLLQLGMASLNHTRLSAGVLPQLATRQGWLTATFVLSWLLTQLARRGAQQAVDEGIKTGLAIERAWAWRDLYADVIRSLSTIATRTAKASTENDLLYIRGLALDEVDHLRSSLDHDRNRSRFAADMERLAATFRSHGLRVELVTSQLTADPRPAASDALAAAVNGALRAVMEHAAVLHAVVRVSNVDDGVEVIVRDHGLGGPQQAAVVQDRTRAELNRTGGTVEIRSTIGNGTRVRLHVPSPVNDADSA